MKLYICVIGSSWDFHKVFHIWAFMTTSKKSNWIKTKSTVSLLQHHLPFLNYWEKQTFMEMTCKCYVNGLQADTVLFHFSSFCHKIDNCDCSRRKCGGFPGLHGCMWGKLVGKFLSCLSWLPLGMLWNWAVADLAFLLRPSPSTQPGFVFFFVTCNFPWYN